MRMRAMGAIGLSAATALTAVALSPVTATAATPAATSAAKHRTFADFNGDGYPDLAISATEATVGAPQQAGAVSVAYGSAAGIGKTGTQLLTRADLGGGEAPEAGGRWGVIKGFGDLDGDGFDDLVVANSPGEGRTWVLWGGKKGLSGGVLLAVNAGTTPHALDYWSLHVGDTDGDGIADLVGSITRSGSSGTVAAGFGVVRGPLTRSGGFKPVQYRETFTRDDAAPHGFVIADFTGDGRPDLGAISAKSWAQSLMVYKNTGSGWTASRKIALPGDRYMWMRPVVGDINGDGIQDMVLGHRWTYTDPFGKIFVAYGGKEGFSTTLKPRLIDEDTPGVPGLVERQDKWGEARALADVDKDGYADLAVGAPYKDAQGGTVSRAGSVTILRGGPKGLTTTGARTVTQATTGVPSTSEKQDRFGEALAWVDGDRNGTPELYVGGPGEDGKAGRVWQLPAGTGTGATSFNLKDTGHPSGPALFGGQFEG
ncbi:FG-GAP-like repeat-containing protein [Streptomyces sp. NPDC089919]|uniref:FG-GAP-like repeat-containing protein n=1 Tax=Streptomyces sp. NPDC089919 TaxID=3155188 RepID=UPI003418100B